MAIVPAARRAGEWTACLVLCLVAGAASAAGPQIIQAVVLELTAIEVQVIVADARGDEQLQCFLRRADGRTRLGSVGPLSSGLVSGSSTLLSVVLPLLDPGEMEFAVALVRGGAEL
ncbi:MAG: hypothetical protein L0027_09845, partial [Candidatus Rokubacteria bacterium]|nr:hypothetical protein [Candidatus Rokubacteria bacterium]